MVLQAQDNTFFEAYKRLDRLCSDMYSQPSGVSAYIADMESKAAQGRFRISSWEQDYKRLKRIRWVRNQLAHNSVAYRMSEETDLRFVEEFHRRILSGLDPLTQLRKRTEPPRVIPAKAPQPQQPVQELSPASSAQPSAPRPPKKRARTGAALLIFLGVVLLLYAAYLWFTS